MLSEDVKLSPPQISKRVFEALADEEEDGCCSECGEPRWRAVSGAEPTHGPFNRFVRQQYTYTAYKAGLEPCVISEARLSDAWQQFRFDRKHYRKSLPNNNMPNHFKLSGTLAFWLRRTAPVYGFRDLNRVKYDEGLRELLEKFGAEYLAFDLGLSICEFFENNQAGREKKLVPDFPPDFYETVTYFMKFKNLSPHAMGIIYRSLFIPMKAKPEPGGG